MTGLIPRLRAINPISVTPPIAKQINKSSVGKDRKLDNPQANPKPIASEKETNINHSPKVLARILGVIPEKAVPSPTPMTNWETESNQSGEEMSMKPRA